MSSSGIPFCDTCRVEFKSRAILKFHLKKVHGQILTEGSNLVHDPDKVREAFCTTCQKEFKSRAILKFHLRKEHGVSLIEEDNLGYHQKDDQLGLPTEEKQLLNNRILKFGKLTGIPDFVNAPFRLLRPILTQTKESQTQGALNAAVDDAKSKVSIVGSDKSNPSPVSIQSPPTNKEEERNLVTENSDDELSVIFVAESIPNPLLKENFSQNSMNEVKSDLENFEMPRPRQHKRSAASSFISETSSYKDLKRIKLNSEISHSMPSSPKLSLGCTTDEVPAVTSSMANNSFLLSPDQSPPQGLDQRSVTSPVASETASSVGRKKISLRSYDEVSHPLSLSPSSNIGSESASLKLTTANQESQDKRRSGSMTSLVDTESMVSSSSSFSSMSGGKRRSSCGKFSETCAICGKTGFKNSSRYINHLEIHEGKRPFVCPICGSGYETDMKLLQHNSLRHSKEAPFKCEKCGKEYKVERAFQNHTLSCSSSD